MVKFVEEFVPDTWSRFPLIKQKFGEGAKNKTALDAGCGTGFFSYELLKKNYKTVSVDISSANIRHLKKVLSPKFSKYSFPVVCDLQYLPFQKESFNFIFCTEVLEHVKNDLEVLKLFNFILKKRGRLLLTMPKSKKRWKKSFILFKIHNYYKNLIYSKNQKHPEIHKHPGYTKKELKIMFEKSNFKILDIRSFGSFLHMFVIFSFMILEKKDRISEYRDRSYKFSQADHMVRIKSLKFKIYYYIIFPIYKILLHFDKYFKKENRIFVEAIKTSEII